jgi:hypothetical protein
LAKRYPIRKARRRAFQQIADRHPADPARTRHAAGCREIGHADFSLIFVIARSEATKQSSLRASLWIASLSSQ